MNVSMVAEIACIVLRNTESCHWAIKVHRRHAADSDHCLKTRMKLTFLRSASQAGSIMASSLVLC